MDRESRTLRSCGRSGAPLYNEHRPHSAIGQKVPIQLHLPSSVCHRIRAARLRRNLSQAAVAKRVGITRNTYVDLEAGRPTVGLSVLVKDIGILGYIDRISELLETEPIGEAMERASGRKRAGSRRALGDF